MSMLIREVNSDDNHRMELTQDGANCFSVTEYTPNNRVWSFIRQIPELVMANTRFDNNIKFSRSHNVFYVSD